MRFAVRSNHDFATLMQNSMNNNMNNMHVYVNYEYYVHRVVFVKRYMYVDMMCVTILI